MRNFYRISLIMMIIALNGIITPNCARSQELNDRIEVDKSPSHTIVETQNCSSHSKINFLISRIPFEDRQRLERLFHYLIHYSEFGYTLCGDKPLSIEKNHLLSEMRPDHTIVTFLNCHWYNILSLGGKTWNRYSHLFPSKNFVLKFMPDCNMFSLINKKACMRTVEQNIELFKKLTNLNYSIREFMEEICLAKNQDRLTCHITLLGILLGYGKNNAIAFSSHNILQKLKPFMLEKFYYGISSFVSPGFLLIHQTNNYENKKIIKSLKEAKRTILKNFNQGNYLEIFIKLYCN